MIQESPKFPGASAEQLQEAVVSAYLGLGRKGKTYSIRQIADRMGVSYHTIHKTLQQCDIELRQRGRPEVVGPDTLRRCCRCGGVFAVRDFVTNKNQPGGHGYRCKSCDRADKRRGRHDED